MMTFREIIQSAQNIHNNCKQYITNLFTQQSSLTVNLAKPDFSNIQELITHQITTQNLQTLQANIDLQTILTQPYIETNLNSTNNTTTKQILDFTTKEPYKTEYLHKKYNVKKKNISPLFLFIYSLMSERGSFENRIAIW